MTRSQEVATDVAALLRARNPLLWIVTREEARVERYLVEAAAAAKLVPRTWDVAQGFAAFDGADLSRSDLAQAQDPGAALNIIQARSNPNVANKERALWILRDMPAWISGISGASVLRQLRNLARSLPSAPRDQVQAIVILTPNADVPPELVGHATVIEWPMPDRAEIADILDVLVEQYDIKLNGQREPAIDAAVGLSGEEAQSCYARSLVQTRGIDPSTVANEKKRLIARERVLEWYDPLPGGLDSVGGLDGLKSWLVSRASAYSPEAKAYGLRSPRGALLVGISGCGKSLTAKAIATAWRIPLLRLDLGALKSKFVGESEGNLRRAIKVIEAIGRCVVWIDEVEKALQGATSGSADGGVSSDALGTILSWMQERQGESFVIATANDITALPPEFLRKGRFDEIFFVDLPTQEERGQILDVALRQNGRAAVAIDAKAVAEACTDFTGAEIAEIVPEALFTAFNDGGREISTDDLLAAAKTVVPLAKTASEKIKTLREWAAGRARSATTRKDNVVQPGRARQIDI